jgi:hypothetical protein
METNMKELIRLAQVDLFSHPWTTEDHTSGTANLDDLYQFPWTTERHMAGVVDPTTRIVIIPNPERVPEWIAYLEIETPAVSPKHVMIKKLFAEEVAREEQPAASDWPEDCYRMIQDKLDSLPPVYLTADEAAAHNARLDLARQEAKAAFHRRRMDSVFGLDEEAR